MKHATHRKKVTVHNEEGLQMKLAARLAQEAQKFASRIHLVFHDAKVDAKSVLDILTLAAGNGAMLSIEAQGHDAYAAIGQLSEVFEESDVKEPSREAFNQVRYSESRL